MKNPFFSKSALTIFFKPVKTKNRHPEEWKTNEKVLVIAKSTACLDMPLVTKRARNLWLDSNETRQTELLNDLEFFMFI